MPDPYEKAILEAEIARVVDRELRHPLDEILARPEHDATREAWERNEETGKALFSAFQRCWIASNPAELAGAISFVARNLPPWAQERRVLKGIFVRLMMNELLPIRVISQDPRLKAEP